MRKQSDSLLRFITCVSVYDGKSTLIGRLLYESKTILSDTYNQIEKTSQKRGLNAVDLSLLTDGLQAEREQGITIDVAYRYFSTPTPPESVLISSADLSVKPTALITSSTPREFE